jgi:hypothetical protein
MCVNQDKWTALINLNARRSDAQNVTNALGTYFNTYPGREGYEFSLFKEWVHDTAKETELKYIDTQRRNTAALDAANANLQAATKVYDALVAQKQMYDMQIAELKQHLAEKIAPIQ